MVLFVLVCYTYGHSSCCLTKMLFRILDISEANDAGMDNGFEGFLILYDLIYIVSVSSVGVKSQ